MYSTPPPAPHPPANICNNITNNGQLPLAPVIAILGHTGHDNEQNAIIISPQLHNPTACPSSILLLDRRKFDAAAFNSMLVDCYMRHAPGVVLRVGIALIVDELASVSVTVPVKLHIFYKYSQKFGKNKKSAIATA
jgi:hypothetical protein